MAKRKEAEREEPPAPGTGGLVFAASCLVVVFLYTKVITVWHEIDGSISSLKRVLTLLLTANLN